MRKMTIFLLVVILGSSVLMLTSCETLVVHHKPGLEPPAHGLRNKQPKTVVLVDVKK